MRRSPVLSYNNQTSARWTRSTKESDLLGNSSAVLVGSFDGEDTGGTGKNVVIKACISGEATQKTSVKEACVTK
jgi:hypothetical protein